MKRIIPFYLWLIVCLASFSAFAEPKEGFGIYVGGVSSSMDGEFKSNSIIAGTKYSNTSSGFSAGVDYQFVLSDFLSINPIWMSSSESISGDVKSSVKSVGHGILALQVLIWAGDLYFGPHIGNYSEVLVSEDSNSEMVSTAATGPGGGFVVGYKIGDKIFVNLQYDNAKIEYIDADENLQGIRFHVGYRWE